MPVLRWAGLLLLILSPPLGAQVSVSGTVYDTVSGRPIAHAVVRVTGVDTTSLANGAGRFRIVLQPGRYTLEIRKIGFHMGSVSIVVTDTAVVQDVYLEPIALDLEALVVTAEGENPATRIIRAAIARKNDVLDRIHDYRYDAYVKLVIRDAAKPRDSTDAVLLLTETQTAAYWQKPDKYLETIVARRQSSNLNADNNLVSVGQIVNFNRDRIELAKYAIVSPTADDALDHYDYHLLDTLEIDGRVVFRLAIEPRSDAVPLFAGLIDIADSTWDVLAIDVGVNEAARVEFFDNLRYRQRMRDHGDDRWMPFEIMFTGEIHFGIPIPGLPKRIGFEHIVTLKDFRFDEGDAPPDLGEFIVVVDERADDADSASWEAARPNPLATVEQAAYVRIDSMEHEPAGVGSYLGTGFGLVLLATANRDFFRFNRVDGAYLGAGRTWRDWSPDLVVRTQLGYGTSSNLWQYEFGGRYRFSERQRFWLGAYGQDGIVNRPTLVSSGYNPTYLALIARLDPLDYYRERGYRLTASTKLVNFTTFGLVFRDVEQTSVERNTSYSLFKKDGEARPNAPIADGRLRSLTATLTYDSRALLKSKGRDFRIGSLQYSRISVEYEVSNPSLIPSDFKYQRLGLRVFRQQRTLGFGLTSFTGYGGIGWGNLPPQRYFTVDFGRGAFFEKGGFNTLDQINFGGDRVVMLVANHDFDNLLFRRLPLLEKLPFTFQIHGGVFWSEFKGQRPPDANGLIPTATSAYSELGFGLANLTPWISPFNFGVFFSWQLSNYGTRSFEFRIGVPGV